MTQADPAQPLACLSDTIADTVAAAAQGVVSIHSHGARSSGFALQPDLIVTADEALVEEGEVAVTLPGADTRPASIIGRDPSTDIALLHVSGAQLPAVALADEPSRAGMLVMVVGNREGVPLQALGLLAKGASNKAIANRLGISVHTAKFHVGSLIDKLDAVGRTDAVTHAARIGVLHL